MSDSELRELERAGREAPQGSLSRARWRLALTRAGRSKEAGLEAGDLVEVVERRGRDCFVWFPDRRRWRGVLVRVGCPMTRGGTVRVPGLAPDDLKLASESPRHQFPKTVANTETWRRNAVERNEDYGLSLSLRDRVRLVRPGGLE